MAKKKSPEPDLINTPGLKHILEDDVPLAVKLLKEEKRHILVRGEPRTGKSHIRDKLSELSGLTSLGKINCTSFPDTLVDSILFGIEEGVASEVTGRRGLLTDQSKEPKIILLEEIGELPPYLQAKLLVYLEKGEFHPVGADWEEGGTSTLRIIATSNAPDEKFRPDFLARFWEVRVPPIHERREDIPKFLEHFLKGDEAKLLPEEWFYLMTYNWPGGVSEIENVCIKIKHYLFGKKKILRHDFITGLLNIKTYSKNNYFDFCSYMVDRKNDPLIAKLFPHFESSFWGKKNPIPTYKYDSLIKEWEAWCFFFFQIPKSPTNIYEDIQELKHKTVPYGYSESPYAFLSDPPSIFNRYNPFYKYFINFFKIQRISKKEGIKLLDILSHKAIIYLYDKAYNEEKNNEKNRTNLKYNEWLDANVSQKDLLTNYWTYLLDVRGLSNKEAAKVAGVTEGAISKKREKYNFPKGKK